MAPRLIWSPRARRNLHDLLAYVAESAPGSAEVIARRFFTHADLLPDHPGQGRRVRSIRVRASTARFSSTAGGSSIASPKAEIRIVAIVHGARLLRNLPPL